MTQTGCEIACNITWNILGGVIVAILFLYYEKIKKKILYRKFRKVFGNNLDDFHLVYPTCNSPSIDTVYPKPPSKVPRRSISTVHLTTINSSAITRSISHLSYAIGNCSPSSLLNIESDIDLDQQMDLSFLSLGGLNNYKSFDILEDKSNNFLQFVQNGIYSKTSGKSIVNIEGNFDYGLILKIHPEHNTSRTWLCIAGIGEWGTSGAALWLSRNWKEVYKRVKDKPFACITKTKYASDDSTSLVHLFLSKEDVEMAANQNT